MWRWNRAIYDASADGHVRVELRALPSGPTPIDMAANTAFLIGLTLGMREHIDQILHQFPFEYAHRNFYRAAECGMATMFVWPNRVSHGLREYSAYDLAKELLPVAEQGLEDCGVNHQEIQTMLQVIRDRLDARINGARWQTQRLALYEQRGHDRPAALNRMLEDYLHYSQSDTPISQWGLDLK